MAEEVEKPKEKEPPKPLEKESKRPALEALRAEIVDPLEEPLPPIWGDELKKHVRRLVSNMDDPKFMVRERAEEELVRLLDGPNLLVYPRKLVPLPTGTTDLLIFDPRIHSPEQAFRLRRVRSRMRENSETPVTRLMPGERESAMKVIDEINEKAGFTFIYVSDDARPLLKEKMAVRDPFVLEKGLPVRKASPNSAAGILLELCEKHNLAFQPAGRSVLLFRQKENDPRRMFSSQCGRLLGCTIVRVSDFDGKLEDNEIYAFDPHTEIPGEISNVRRAPADPRDPKYLSIEAKAPIQEWKKIVIPFPTKEPILVGNYKTRVKESQFSTRKGFKGLAVEFEMERKDFNDLIEWDLAHAQIQLERTGKPILYKPSGYSTNQSFTAKLDRRFELDDEFPDTARVFVPVKRSIKTLNYDVTVPPQKK